LQLTKFDVNPPSVNQKEPLRFTLAIRATENTTVTELNVLIYSLLNVRVALIDLRKVGLPIVLERGDGWNVTVTVTALPLIEGDYSVGVYVNATNFLDDIYNLGSFRITSCVTTFGYAPYAAMYRGLVELDYEVGAHLRRNSMVAKAGTYTCLH